jgi:hypothetical protein
VTVAGELAAHGATQGGVVGEEAGVVYAPHEFLLMGELSVGECGVFFVECEVELVDSIMIFLVSTIMKLTVIYNMYYFQCAVVVLGGSCISHA